jgi:hypothetical protein
LVSRLPKPHFMKRDSSLNFLHCPPLIFISSFFAYFLQLALALVITIYLALA